MTNTTVITITRPNTSVDFFYDSIYWYTAHFKILSVYTDFCNQRKILSLDKNISTDELTSTRTIIFSNSEAKTEFGISMCQELGLSVDEFMKIRQEYCDTSGHTLSIFEL